jgi:20S proteasome subunit alpha 6
MDGQALDNVHEASPTTSLATTQAADVPEAQDPAASLDTGSGPDMTVVGHQAVAPHPEQVDGALSGPFEISGAVDANNELAASAPPSEEGASVISPSSSAPAVPDSSVIASSSSSDTSVAAPPTESVALDEEPPADHAHSPDVPAPTAPDENSASSASFIERSLTHQIDSSVGETRVATVDDLLQFDPTTQPELHFDGPASSDTSTLISGSTASTISEPNRLPMKTESQPVVRTPSPNRLSISYAAGTKRLVINAEIVEQLKILRSDGRVEITMRVEKADANELNGIIVGSFP